MIIGPRQNLFLQTSNTIQTLAGAIERGKTGGNQLRLGRFEEKMDKGKCKFWVAKKRRFCANSPLHDSLFCGNHIKREDGQWVPCPIDPSHSVLNEKLKKHIKKCPSVKQAQSLSAQPYYQKGINCGCANELEGVEKEEEEEDVSSELKRKAVYSMTALEFSNLLNKLMAVHQAICSDIPDSYKAPMACDVWIKGEVDRKIPYEEKHVLQQASILGNLEEFGVLKNYLKMSKGDHLDSPASCEGKNAVPAVIEFGAGRGYLTQTLADCYGIKKVLLVERKSYKLKADRSLRQKDCLQLERLRIDIEDLNLNAVESLRGVPYLAIGKHLCGPATDLTLRCCLGKNRTEQGVFPQLCGLAVATCCHHLCQWKHYTNKAYLTSLGISKEDFHAMSWLTSWAVDAKHGSDVGAPEDRETLHYAGNEDDSDENSSGLEEIKKMSAADRASVGFKCKDIIDMGRMKWVKESGLEAAIVNYVPLGISPENHLLVAKHCCN